MDRYPPDRRWNRTGAQRDSSTTGASGDTTRAARGPSVGAIARGRRERRAAERRAAQSRHQITRGAWHQHEGTVGAHS
eukprot:5401660-Alexandrium_andersonii.AAC.1